MTPFARLFFRLFWGGMALFAVPAFALTLNPNGVVPRIFSPNNDGINDVVYFALDNPTLTGVSGKIMDVSGADVAELQAAGPLGPTFDSLVWDGRDRSGEPVPAGPYLYLIEGGGARISGVVVVAR